MKKSMNKSTDQATKFSARMTQKRKTENVHEIRLYTKRKENMKPTTQTGQMVQRMRKQIDSSKPSTNRTALSTKPVTSNEGTAR